MSTQLTVQDVAERLGLSSSGVLAQVRSIPREGKVTLAVASSRLGRATVFDAAAVDFLLATSFDAEAWQLRKQQLVAHSVELIKAMSAS